MQLVNRTAACTCRHWQRGTCRARDLLSRSSCPRPLLVASPPERVPCASVSQGNDQGESNINFKGIMVGNGCTGSEVGICGNEGEGMRIEKDFLAGHALMSLDVSAQVCLDDPTPSFFRL
jgi:hypothetical protein